MGYNNCYDPCSSCADCQPVDCGCKVSVPTECVINTSKEYACLGIKKGDKLDSILDKVEELCLSNSANITFPDGLNLINNTLQLTANNDDIVFDSVSLSSLGVPIGAENGLNFNAGTGKVRLGGLLIEDTNILQDSFSFDLSDATNSQGFHSGNNFLGVSYYTGEYKTYELGTDTYEVLNGIGALKLPSAFLRTLKFDGDENSIVVDSGGIEIASLSGSVGGYNNFISVEPSGIKVNTPDVDDAQIGYSLTLISNQSDVEYKPNPLVPESPNVVRKYGFVETPTGVKDLYYVRALISVPDGTINQTFFLNITDLLLVGTTAPSNSVVRANLYAEKIATNRIYGQGSSTINTEFNDTTDVDYYIETGSGIVNFIVSVSNKGAITATNFYAEVHFQID